MRDLSQILHADMQTNCHKTMSQIFDIIPKILSHINHTYCTSLQELLPAERREEEAGDPALSEEHAPPERRTLPPLRIRKGTGNGAAKRRSDQDMFGRWSDAHYRIENQERRIPFSFHCTNLSSCRRPDKFFIRICTFYGLPATLLDHVVSNQSLEGERRRLVPCM